MAAIFDKASWRDFWISQELLESAEMKHKIFETNKETQTGAKTETLQ